MSTPTLHVGGANGDIARLDFIERMACEVRYDGTRDCFMVTNGVPLIKHMLGEGSTVRAALDAAMAQERPNNDEDEDDDDGDDE